MLGTEFYHPEVEAEPRFELHWSRNDPDLKLVTHFQQALSPSQTDVS